LMPDLMPTQPVLDSDKAATRALIVAIAVL
jgi:hypothetical protein